MADKESGRGGRKQPEPEVPEPEEAVEEEPKSSLSDLEAALLGLLSIRPTSGYDIRQSYARALAPWWETPRTQIYPKLRELQKRGLIEDEHVIQQGRPNKRMYSITAEGRAELEAWLTRPIAWPDMRHQMMMRLFFGNLLPPEVARAQLQDYRDRTAEWAASLRETRDHFAEALAGPYPEAVFFELLSLDHLIAIAELECRGATTALTALEKIPAGLDREGGEATQLLEAIRDLLG